MADEGKKGEMKYCPVAWHSVNIRNNGDFRLCCHANVAEGQGILRQPDGSPYNLATSSVDSVRNHPLAKAVRKSFLEGKWHPSCARCQLEEENSQPSGRVHSLNRLEEAGLESEFRDTVFSRTAADGSIESERFPVYDLDIRFGNKCNLRCRSCGPTDSSSWYGDYFKMGYDRFEDSGATVFLKEADGRIVAENNRFEWYENISVGSQLPQDLSRLRRIYFAGGEPLLIRQHQEMLEWLVARNLHGQVGLEYNTNLTVLPDAILDLWKKFRFVGVGVSMDGYGKYHEYLRHPGRFDTMERNLRKLDQAEGNIRRWLACTVSAQNASHLPDFVLWKERQGYKKIRNDLPRLPISTHLLHYPNYMNLQALPLKAKLLVEARLAEGFSRIEKEGCLPEGKLRSTKRVFDGIVRYMKSGDRSRNWPSYWEYNEKLDRIRKQTFFDIDPELAALMQEGARPAGYLEAPRASVSSDV